LRLTSKSETEYASLYAVLSGNHRTTRHPAK
jgi:hypothetical protein